MNTSFIIVSFLILGISGALIPASHPPISTQRYGYDVKGNTASIANQLGTNYDISNQANAGKCISYDKSERSILISCGLVHLTDIANQINEQNVIKKESDSNWLLDAGIIIENGATLILDPQDTKWLKILADGIVAHGIHVYGSLVIDSIKLTSWNPSTNNYAQSYGSRETSGKITHPGAPRPFIRIESGSTGTTNITNSEIAYLGYEGDWGSGTSGIHYHNGGDGSIIRNNKIHDLYFGFYSNSVGDMLIENNLFYNNGHYGIDPHTETHDMIIRNNTVYGNNGTAIICSLDCYNILIEKNNVYSNNGYGITFSRNMTNSVVRNNFIHNQNNAIFVSASHNNEVYNNTIFNSDDGISFANGSSNNKVHDNRIINSVNALRFNADSHENALYSNKIVNATQNTIKYDDDQNTKDGNNTNTNSNSNTLDRNN
ncbi:MAG TPA: right-handed parallel beta-helix repeat-containing protein [Nitrososphaeraceae archaeon]